MARHNLIPAWFAYVNSYTGTPLRITIGFGIIKGARPAPDCSSACAVCGVSAQARVPGKLAAGGLAEQGPAVWAPACLWPIPALRCACRGCSGPGAVPAAERARGPGQLWVRAPWPLEPVRSPACRPGWEGPGFQAMRGARCPGNAREAALEMPEKRPRCTARRPRQVPVHDLHGGVVRAHPALPPAGRDAARADPRPLGAHHAVLHWCGLLPCAEALSRSCRRARFVQGSPRSIMDKGTVRAPSRWEACGQTEHSTWNI